VAGSRNLDTNCNAGLPYPAKARSNRPRVPIKTLRIAQEKPMTSSQSCKKCHGTGKVKDRSSGKRVRCTSCAGTGMVMTAAAKA
jgi:hypothetical protein